MSQRPRVLIELGVELERAARDAGRRRRIRLPAARLPSLGGVTTVVAVGCAVAVAGFAIIALGHGRHALPTPSTKPGSSQPARRLSGDLRAWFAALRRPPTAADRLPTQIALSMAHQSHLRGLISGSSRRVISTHDLQVWVVLIRRQLCEVEVQSGPRVPTRSGFGAGCIGIAGAETYGLVSAGRSFEALLPDGTSKVRITLRDGSSTLLTPNADGVILYRPKHLMSGYSFTGPTGARINRKVVIAPPPPRG
jgi:hypothetical protein